VPILLDKKSVHAPSYLNGHSTLGDTLKWVQTTLPQSRILVKIELDGELLQGDALSEARKNPLGKSTLKLTTGDQKELSLTLLGKLAALIEWLAPQHKDVAGMFERGETQKALERLGGILSAWQEIQAAYANLARMMTLSLKDLRVHELSGEAVLDEFCRQLGEVQTALHNNDFVLLSDILQYEMDGAVANWMALLESTLGIVEPATA
jgi:hypothetical protein